MGLLKFQTDGELDLETPRDRENEIEREHELFDGFLVACRKVVREVGGYDEAAAALQLIWGPRGRHVTAQFLRSCLVEDSEAKRNYFRIEWLFWFAAHSETIRQQLLEVAGHGKPKKKPEDELEDLKRELRSEFPKHAEKLIRKAGTP